MKGNKNSLGYKHTEEAKQKISENNGRGMLGKTHSEESRQKQSNAKKGEKNYNYGKSVPEEVKQKMRGPRKNKGKSWTACQRAAYEKRINNS